MRKFKCLLFVLKRSYICYYIIYMIVHLKKSQHFQSTLFLWYNKSMGCGKGEGSGLHFFTCVSGFRHGMKLKLAPANLLGSNWQEMASPTCSREWCHQPDHVSEVYLKIYKPSFLLRLEKLRHSTVSVEGTYLEQFHVYSKTKSW